MSPRYKKPKPAKERCLILTRRDGSVSVKVPGRNPFIITPGQTTDMRATVAEMRLSFAGKGWAIDERVAK